VATNLVIPDLGPLQSRKRKAPERWDPAAANSIVKTHDVEGHEADVVESAKKRLKTASDSANFNAAPTLRMSGDICLIETGSHATTLQD
jgi:hypothetical protein